MKIFYGTLGPKGEIVLPDEFYSLLGLVEGDKIEISVDVDGKIYARGAERSPGPLSGFFEDLILSDLRNKGISGNDIKEHMHVMKIRLSTLLDRLAEEADFFKDAMNWRKVKEFEGSINSEPGKYTVKISNRALRDLYILSESELKDVAGIFEVLEQDPTKFKRLSGPYYETYRVAFDGVKSEQNRIVYTVVEEAKKVHILCIGNRKQIYKWLKGLA